MIAANPFEVPLPSDLGVTGVVLADQAKSLDWRARRARFLARLPGAVLKDVLTKLNLLLVP